MRYLLKLLFCCLLFLITGTKSFCQSNTDSVQTLTPEKFFDLILQYHPVAKQADLIPQYARQQLVVARGGFDPYFFSSLDQKQFSEKEYFLLNESGFKVPTWYGIELKGSYTFNKGTNLNPENTMPVNGQALAGISVPIGQGLFMDERRAVLKQAKVFTEASVFERITMLNDLLFAAAKEYWEWTYQYNNYIVFQDALTVADERFIGVKKSLEFGDIPAIDTLEAFINLQNLQFNANEAFMLYRNATYNLSNFLWFENNVPLEITDKLQPINLQNINFQNTPKADSIEAIINAISITHPEIRSLQLFLKQLDIERKLKLEYLKPRINLNYNVLSVNQFTFNTNPEFANLFNTNYKWGFDIAFPLFWGKGRGNYKLAKLKIADTEYKLQLKQLEIINKIQTYFNELTILRAQVDLYEDATQNYNRLLIAEEIKFQTGESSMFLINARQMKLLEFQIKLLEVKSKYFKALAGVAWSSGTIATQ